MFDSFRGCFTVQARYSNEPGIEMRFFRAVPDPETVAMVIFASIARLALANTGL